MALTIHDILLKQANFGRVDIAVLAFRKAFDTVPHNRLLTKLKHYGIAGNTPLYRPICDVSDSVALQRDLSSIESWSEAWGLRFNIQKCNIISTGKRPFFYQLDGCIVKHVSNHPYLGVELSESLTFSVHVANIVSSACQKLSFLRQNLKRCPRDVTSLAYYAFVRSRLEYCCAIWDPHQAGEINRLEGVQRNAARFVCSEYRRGPCVMV